MTNIKFSLQEKEQLIDKLQRYFSKELNQELGQFDADFLLDFFSDEIGAHFYNRGLYDAQAILTERLESIADAIYEIEKPTQ